MSLPTFVAYPKPTATAPTIKPNAAAARLGISRGSLDKLVGAGILPPPISADLVEELARRPKLAVSSGELTVLRTAARATAYDEDRAWIGFHIDHTDDEVDQTSLRWWRSEPDRVIGNQLYAVTVSTVPVAVYSITRVLHSQQRTTETGLRHHYEGTLLARIGTGPGSSTSPHGLTTTPIFHLTAGHPLLARVETIMGSRITVSSGGPIGYLEPHRA